MTVVVREFNYQMTHIRDDSHRMITVADLAPDKEFLLCRYAFHGGAAATAWSNT